MVLKSCRIALEWAVGLVVGLALLAALGLFWLSREPLAVDFVRPYIEAALSGEQVSVEVGETELVWAGWGSRIQVAARDWTVYGADDRRLLTIPRGAIELSLSALLEGQIAPTAITLHDLRISLLRRPDGRFALGRQTVPEAAEEAAPGQDEPRRAGEPAPGDGQATGEGTVEAAEQSVLRFLFTPLADKPDPANPFAQLARISIVEASAVLIDQRLNRLWRAPFVDLEIQRDPAGVSATGSASLALGDKRAQLALTMTKAAGGEGLETVIDVAALEPAALAGAIAGAEPLEALSGTLEGHVGLTIAEDGRPTAARLELGSQALTLDLPDLLEQPLTFHDLRLEAHSAGLETPIVLERLTGSVAPAAGGEGPSFSARAVAQPRPESFRVELVAEVTDIPAADMELYWPKGVGGGGRAWVAENITGGTATSATLSAALSVDRESHRLESIDAFGGRFRYEGLEVHYLRPLPPLTGAAGSAAYDLAGLDFTVETAQLGQIALDSGAISIFGLEGTDHRISLAFDAAGPLQEALALLDHERLGLLDKLALDPQSASGRFDVRSSFAFPLIDELQFEQIEIGVEGAVVEVALEGAVAGHDLADGHFELALDAQGLRTEGRAAVAGIPLTATWRESFQAVETPTEVTATVPEVRVAELARFGFDAGEHAEGPLSLKLDIAADHAGDARVALAADLQQVRAGIPTIGWDKPPGRPASLEAVLRIEDDDLVGVEGLSISAGDDSAEGEIALADGGGLERVAFQRLTLGRNSVADLIVTPYEGDGYAVSVGGGVLDLAPLLGEEGVAPEPEEAVEASERDSAGPPYRPLKLEAPALARVRLARGRALENVSLELERDRRGWQLIRAEAQIPRELWRLGNRQVPEDAGLAAKTMSAHYRPEGDGSYRFELFADDIGATLRALGWVESLEGGQGAIVGTLPAPLPEGPLHGRLETKGFRLVEAPAMAKLLTVASLTGIGNLLSGEGIQFDRAVGEFTLADDVIQTPLFRAYGSSLGITAKGQIDLEGAATDISGTLVPAYSVNRILGEIPILGQILTGGEGEGVLAVTYRVTGRLEDPEVSVNPLSILAPGFLRGLFGVPRPDSEEPEELTDVFPSGEVGR